MQATAQASDFDQLARTIDRAMDQFIRHQFSQFRAADVWTPAINAYRMADRIEVCVDLAGVERDSIDVRVEAGRLMIRGLRHTPLPEHEAAGEASRILVMEIEHGPFERSLQLPHGVDVERVTADQLNGLLCIRLPLRPARNVARNVEL